MARYTDDDFDFWELHAPDCECRFTGDVADASACDLHGLDAGDVHLEPITCPVRRAIFASSATLGEISDAVKLHRLEYCEFCGQLDGFVRPELRRAA